MRPISGPDRQEFNRNLGKRAFIKDLGHRYADHAVDLIKPARRLEVHWTWMGQERRWKFGRLGWVVRVQVFEDGEWVGRLSWAAEQQMYGPGEWTDVRITIMDGDR